MIEEDPNYDAFASARLQDSLKILRERETVFQVCGHEHHATQDLSGGGIIVETITVTWRPKPPEPNGYSYRRAAPEQPPNG